MYFDSLNVNRSIPIPLYLFVPLSILNIFCSKITFAQKSATDAEILMSCNRSSSSSSTLKASS